jgi:hypothetical protein
MFVGGRKTDYFAALSVFGGRLRDENKLNLNNQTKEQETIWIENKVS